tara:strand:- start:332 stop:847 length:516 start_codon:yes stop_codon:yes gene_type:complete
MPKVEISNRGLIQTTGNGLQIDLPVTLNSSGLSGVRYSTETSIIKTGGGRTDLTVDVPPGALLTDVGVVCTDGVDASESLTITAKVGTGVNGAQICAAANFASAVNGADVIEAGHAISTSGANGEGAAALAFVAECAMRATAARTVYFTVTHNTGNLESGKVVCYAAYAVV